MNRNICKGLFFLLLPCLLFNCGKEFWHPEGADISGPSSPTEPSGPTDPSGENKNPLVGTSWVNSDYGFKMEFSFDSNSTGTFFEGSYGTPFAYEYSDSILTIHWEGKGNSAEIYISGDSFSWSGQTFYKQTSGGNNDPVSNNSLVGTRWVYSDYGLEMTFYFSSSSAGTFFDDGYGSPFTYEYDGYAIILHMGTDYTTYITGGYFMWNNFTFFRQ